MADIDPDAVEFGALLRRMRKELGPRMSQVKFAPLVGVTPQQVSAIEKGVRNPSPTVMRLWAEACGRRLAFPKAGLERLIHEDLEPQDQRLAGKLLELLPLLEGGRRRDLESMILRWHAELVGDDGDLITRP